MNFVVVAGARPNFMKVAPILRAFGARPPDDRRKVRLVHTGQHYDQQMSDSFFRDLELPRPDHHLGVGSGSHAQQTARIMTGFEAVCEAERPDCVVVVGDVNSTLGCALTASKLGIAVAHVEAGLRSRDRGMPEEINRLCTDAVSDLLFTTDELAGANLLAEGVDPAHIHFVGNTMIDTLLTSLDRACALPLPDGIAPGGYAVVTLHRPSNVDDPETLTALLDAIVEIAGRIPVVFPIHPRTRSNIEAFGLTHRLNAGAVRLVDPLGYLAFTGLVARSRMVLTDSGGIQEETTVLGIPCITMRENTERPITCTHGTNVLVGTDPGRIRQAVCAALNRAPLTPEPPKMWDGQAGDRIVSVLLQC